MKDIVESDRRLDLPHPREQRKFFGHDAAKARIMEGFTAGKLHHAWMLSGPEGIGKATMAYRIARDVLAGGTPANPVPDDNDPVFRQVAAGAHPDLFVARRPWDHKAKRLKRDIDAETVRAISRFFSQTSASNGWRICIVDNADEMNRTAANALLKILEEPPNRGLFLLISHAPGRLLPTIRSRCMKLDLQPLGRTAFDRVVDANAGDTAVPSGDERDALYALAQGSPGQALSFLRGNGWSVFTAFKALFRKNRPLDGKKTASFVDLVAARGADDNYTAFCRIVLDWVAAQVRAIATGSGPGTEGVVAGPRNLDALSAAWQEIARSIERTNALNLDRRQTVLNALHCLHNASSGRG